MNRTNQSLLFVLAIPFIIVATDSASTVSMIAALVIAVKASISEPSPFIFTIISVFWSERTETRASMKLIVRSRRTSLSDDLFLLLRLTEAMMTLYVVYAAIAIAGIRDIFTGFCRITMRDTGITRQIFRSKSSAADAI